MGAARSWLRTLRKLGLMHDVMSFAKDACIGTGPRVSLIDDDWLAMTGPNRTVGTRHRRQLARLRSALYLACDVVNVRRSVPHEAALRFHFST
jgi:hypothetical protein